MNPTKLQILLADDDSDDCKFFKNILDELPINSDLKTVGDGEQLMDLLIQMDPLPDVLFLDLNMPRKNGFECLEEIKLNEKLNQIPVVIFSTSYEPTMADKLYNKGVRYYICKPADVAELKNVIHIALKLIADQPTHKPNGQVYLLNDLRTKFFKEDAVA